MKILNLYAGIGGNRKEWGNKYEVTAVEIDPNIAEIYQDFSPDDEVIVGDAHEYLLNHFEEYDFIWSSPPCPSHSSFRQNIGVRYKGVKPVYPDMKLYQEIIFLQNNFDGDWVIENVKPYYKYLIEPTFVLQRHPFWSNKIVQLQEFKTDKIRTSQIPELQKLHGFDLSEYKIKDKRKTLRNCVYPPIGKYILDCITNENN